MENEKEVEKKEGNKGELLYLPSPIRDAAMLIEFVRRCEEQARDPHGNAAFGR